MNYALINQLEEKIENVKFGKLQWKLFFLCGMGWAADMMWITGNAIFMNEIGEEWGVPVYQRSALPFGLMLGVFVGSYAWGTISDRRGRMLPFKRTLIISVISGAIGCASMNVWMMAVCFFGAGLGLGGNLAVDGAVFIEYCPNKSRHMLTGMSIVCVFGSILVCGCAWLYLGIGLPEMWRFLLVTIVFITLVSAIFRFSINETPHYLISKGKISEAEWVISEMLKYNGEEGVNIPLNSIEVQQENMPEHLDIRGQIKLLLSPPLRRSLVFYIMIWFFTAFTFTGFGSYLPEIMRRAGAGDTDNQSLYMTMFLQQLSGIPAVILATYLVKSSLGRKWTQAITLLLGSAFIFGFLTSSYDILMVCSVIFYLLTLIAYSVQYAITPEAFPAEVRSSAVGICNCANRLASMISPILAGILLEFTSNDVPAVILFSASLAAAGLSGCFIKETKDMPKINVCQR
ncbi:unnamed protein product [Blepharisma stoltei]|uniref:Major facilitator superfamily (MFS) profile domain-containing protein n=1 Tax=Blepharisma stoltei TaxID=1481888 RepID=A0AAU9JFK5_9CILI|nr:unnamed protein product [Blepharisma stoltei]